MTSEPYRDSIYIDAPPDVVFEYFVDPVALVQWMGDEAFLEPRPGGRFTLRFGHGTVEGRYVEVMRPSRIVVAWGRLNSATMPPGSSVLEVELMAENDGTRVSIVHSGLPQVEQAKHAAAWRHYLQRLADASVATRADLPRLRR